jgi:hypothetical protein
MCNHPHLRNSLETLWRHRPKPQNSSDYCRLLQPTHRGSRGLCPGKTLIHSRRETSREVYSPVRHEGTEDSRGINFVGRRDGRDFGRYGVCICSDADDCPGNNAVAHRRGRSYRRSVSARRAGVGLRRLGKRPHLGGPAETGRRRRERSIPLCYGSEDWAGFGVDRDWLALISMFLQLGPIVFSAQVEAVLGHDSTTQRASAELADMYSKLFERLYGLSVIGRPTGDSSDV